MMFRLVLHTVNLLALSFSAFSAETLPSETCSSPPSSSSSYLQSFDKYTLTYFDGRGLAEIPRTLFATAGVPFTDNRLSSSEFAVLKDTQDSDLAHNLNRLPVLNHDGFVLGQSQAISRYLAAQLNLLGKTAADAASIDALVEHVVDMKASFKKLLSSVDTHDDDEGYFKAVAVWHRTPAQPKLDKKVERQLQWFLQAIEILLPGDGYAVGARPSLADAVLYNVLGENAPEVNADAAVGKLAQGTFFGDRHEMVRVLDMFPKLRQVVHNFGQSDGMKLYLETRGPIKW